MNTQTHSAEQLALAAASQPADRALLAAMVAAVRHAGVTLLARFDPQVRTPIDRNGIIQAIYANDEASLAVVRPLLQQARPTAGWVDDELEGGALPAGEWWVFDAVEGNINHVQGLAEWGISATLIRDNEPVLTAIYEPVADRLYTAVRGAGVAYMNGVPLTPSSKTELNAAIVSTGQARPGEPAETFRRLGASVTAMLHRALVVRMTVPATFQLAQVAGGQLDAFWQYSDVRSGLAAGALLVAEAGGRVTDTQGQRWTLASADFVATAPGLHRAVLAALSVVA